MSEKQQKFERLAEKRVTEAIRILRLIGNLSNKKNYSYTKKHAQQIINAIDNEVKNLKNQFQNAEEEQSGAFTFSKIDKGEK